MSMLEQMFNFAQQVLGIKKGGKRRDPKPRQFGRPANVLIDGRVIKESAIVQFNAVPHITREGKPVISVDKQGRRYQVMCHRAVDRKELRKAIYQAERAKRGRYVGPFGSPSKEARV